MVNNRTRGHSGEREAVNLIKDNLGIDCSRNLDQTRDGGCDIILPGWAVEVKRCRKVTEPLKRSWWAQAHRQAEAMQLEPVVLFRADRAPWKALVALPEYFDRDDQRSVVEMDIELWFAMARESLNIHI